MNINSYLSLFLSPKKKLYVVSHRLRRTPLKAMRVNASCFVVSDSLVDAQVPFVEMGQ